MRTKGVLRTTYTSPCSAFSSALSRSCSIMTSLRATCHATTGLISSLKIRNTVKIFNRLLSSTASPVIHKCTNKKGVFLGGVQRSLSQDGNFCCYLTSKANVLYLFIMYRLLCVTQGVNQQKASSYITHQIAGIGLSVALVGALLTKGLDWQQRKMESCARGRVLLLAGVGALLCSLEVSLNHGQLTGHLQLS